MSRVRGTTKFFKTTIVGGMVVLLPLILFYVLFTFLFYTISGIAKPLLGLADVSEAFKYPLLVDIFAFLFLVALCFFVGLFVSTKQGQIWVNRIERAVLFKLPYYGTLREAVHQLLGNSNMNLFKVVLVDLYGNDTLVTAFLTDESIGDYVTVFVPTGPNPTTGFIYHVKKHQITHIDVKSEEAFRSIISVGTGSGTILNNHYYNSHHVSETAIPEKMEQNPAQSSTQMEDPVKN